MFRFIVDSVNKHDKVISFTQGLFPQGFALCSIDYKKLGEHNNDFSSQNTQRWFLFNKEDEKVLM